MAIIDNQIRNGDYTDVKRLVKEMRDLSMNEEKNAETFVDEDVQIDDVTKRQLEYDARRSKQLAQQAAWKSDAENSVASITEINEKATEFDFIKRYLINAECKGEDEGVFEAVVSIVEELRRRTEELRLRENNE